ncbi:neuron navigator 2 isoform X6 [Parasteatoda tepidariorum]|uniref:neuron navigator 2 isoform X6 n=2 Tax=Parasteatoda tepidariorum TaxID=114398 RepID=UPI001C722E37|nr:neuron navigator 2 isoform X5 [Parasteatoda tepidariorum]
MACLRRGGKNDGSTESLAFNTSKRKSIIQIYTDWANHYLDRGRYKRNIQDLQVDISDGVLLADVIEAVIGTKVPGVVRKPKNQAQMVDNITSCLGYIGELGVQLDGVTSKDVREGNLKVILSLFFNLSRFKQAQKNSSNVASKNSTNAPVTVSNTNAVVKSSMVAPSLGSEMLSKLPSPFRPSSGRGIPCPSNKDVASTNSSSSNPSASKKNKVMAPSIIQQGYVGVGNKGPPSVNSSRSGSPHTSSPSPASFIPQPKSAARERIGLDKNRSRPSSASSTSSIPHLPVKSSLASSNSSTTSGRNVANAKNIPISGSGSTNGSNSMLDKFKLFNPKDKSSEKTKVVGNSNKRTSSSSGFSSARSERSDSSNSICSETKNAQDSSKELSSPSPTSPPSSKPPQIGSSVPKSQVKKIGVIGGIKQGVPKTRQSEGQKDPISSKLEQLKATSKIAKEKNNEKLSKSLDSSNNDKKTGSNPSINSTKNSSLLSAESKSDASKKPEAICIQIKPENQIKQSKIVANLIEKSSSVSPSASSVSVISDVTVIDTAGSNMQSVDNSGSVSSAMDSNCNGQLVSSPNSSIPKPTLAVKGTTKTTKEEKSLQNAGSEINLSTNSPPKTKKIHEPPVGTKLSREDIYVAVHIAGANTQVIDTGQKPQSDKRNMNFSKSERARSEGRATTQTGVSIAMVSPIMSSNHIKGSPKSNSEKALNSSSPVCVDDGKPPKSKSTSNFKMVDPIYDTCNKMAARENGGVLTGDNSTIWEEGEDVLVNIKPMQPLVRASPYGYVRGLGPLSSPRSMNGRMQPGLRIHSEYGETGRLNSSRQFLASLDSARMYGAGMKRVLSGCASLDADYATDVDSYDIASGYLSDGEILRPGYPCRTDDIASGYLSEGGTPVYSRKHIGRARDANREQRIINVLQDDRNKSHPPRHHLKMGFDDSSSVSSGASEFPELSTDDNLTGSSVSSDNNVYGSLKRNQKLTSSHSKSLSNGPSTAANSEKSRKAVEEVVVSTGGSKSKQAHVKKTDSSMQTETSAFHHVSSSSWKKYLLQQQQQDAQSVKSDKSGSKKSVKSSSDSKKSSGTDSHRSKHKLAVVPDRHPEPECPKNQSSKQSLPKAGSSESLEMTGRKSSRTSSSTNSVAPATSSVGGSYSKKTQGATSSNGYNVNGGSKQSGSSKAAVGKRGAADEKTGDLERAPTDEMSQCYGGLERRPAAGAGDHHHLPTSRSKGGSKVKVCGSTQTNTSDLYSAVHSDSEYSSLGRKYPPPPPKQYFMTTPGPGTGLKERVYGSRSILNGSPTPLSDYMMLGGRTPRLSAPLRDMDNYASLDHGPYSWMRHSPSCGTSVTGGRGGGTLTEADSMESLSSTSSSIHAQIQHARANSLTHARLMLHQRELAASPRLSRSNSIRSTKSEKLASYMLQRSSDDPEGQNIYATPSGNAFMAAAIASAAAGNTGSQPTSPSSAPQGGSRYNMYPLSPGTTSSVPNSGSFSNHTGNSRSSMSPYMSGLLLKMNSKDDDIHGSALSLVSTSSSIYSTAEEKQAHEIRKLKRELDQAHEKVTTLTSQLTTNAHMVAAFEQSLSNMTNRLQHLTASAEQKDSELTELRKTIEALKQQSAEAGLTKMALQSMQAVQKMSLQEQRISRQFSTDSMSSVNSCSSACSGNSGKSGDHDKKKKKKGWLRSSFSKAFSRSKKNKNGSVSDVEDIRHLQSDSSTPNSPLLGAGHTTNGGSPTLKQSHSSSCLYEKEDEDKDSPEDVKDLKKQLREKDMMLTDIRLDALSSAHQLENLKETVNKMRSEMSSLKQDNDRLQRLVSTKSLTSSHSSLPLRNSLESLEKRLSASENSGPPSIADMYLNEPRNDQDGKLINVSVYLGCHGDNSIFQKQSMTFSEILIGSISVSSKTKWDLLDNLVKRSFKEYVLRVDPVSNLGLSAESLVNYQVGEIIRSKEADAPELLPCGYIVGDSMHVKLVLKGTRQHSVDAFAFETLIPKSIVQRYISLLTEHRRIILCGPSGTGKTYVAQKLAEYLVLKNGKELSPGSIATFSVDHKSAKELRQYLSNVAEQCETSNVSDLPTVIILDNLHHVGSLGEVFNGFLSAKYQKCPYIIGTMNQATCSTTNLQLHHNFRWVLCANHMEPVKGFLGRYLKRKLIEEEVKTGIRNAEIAKVIDWMPKVWHHLNKYLETHSSSDVTIGPRLFLSCPVDLSGSQVWFTDLWNYSVIPYVLEAVREGLQLYGRRAPWEDPAEWVYETYPWPMHGTTSEPQLLRLRPEDVGYEGHPGPSVGSKGHHTNNPNNEADPLLNMLMRLQEAASYSSPHSNDSDSTSMDSHGSSLHSDELLTSGLESTL